jgi:hypothetical protein
MQGSVPLCKASKAHAIPQTEASASTAPRPPDPLGILLPMGLWCALPDTWANRRGAMMVWRGLRQRAGWPWVTSAPLAHAWVSADRRHVPNCWAECEAGWADQAAFFPRRQPGEAAVVAHGEPKGQAHPCWSGAHVRAECRRRWPAPGALVSAQPRRTAGPQVGGVGSHQVLRRQ